MSDYVVMQGIEIPAKRRERVTAVWPFDEMQVGDCFDEFNVELFDQVRTKASLYGYQQRKKFASRLTRHTDPDCAIYSLRVWRVE